MAGNEVKTQNPDKVESLIRNQPKLKPVLLNKSTVHKLASKRSQKSEIRGQHQEKKTAYAEAIKTGKAEQKK